MKFLTAALCLLIVAPFSHAADLALEVLDEVNLARTQPQRYAQFVADRAPTWRGRDAGALQEAVRFLQKARPLPALSWSEGMGQAALSHVNDSGSRGGRGHTGADGSAPWDRMARYGKHSGHAGENIDYGHREARAIVIALIIDDGVRGRKHRVNLFSKNFRVAGIAVGSHAGFGSMCVMDFATGFAERGQERIATRSMSGGMALF